MWKDILLRNKFQYKTQEFGLKSANHAINQELSNVNSLAACPYCKQFSSGSPLRAKPHHFFHESVTFNFTYIVQVWQNLAQHTSPILLRAPLIGRQEPPLLRSFTF